MKAIIQNKNCPVIINVNIGTIVKGAIDDLDRILRILHTLDIPKERWNYFITPSIENKLTLQIKYLINSNAEWLLDQKILCPTILRHMI